MKHFYSIFFFWIFCCSVLASGPRILFIGDSITDGRWGNGDGSAQPSGVRNHWDMNHIYGSGYMYLCASYYQGTYPQKEYQFFNRGISGNTLTDLKGRWEEDAVAIRPDVISILVGTNDVNVYLDKQDGTSFNFVEWEQMYRSLLTCIRQDNPKVAIVLGEPFVAFTGNMKNSKDFALRDSLIQKLGEIISRIAVDYEAVYIPYASMFRHLLDQSQSLPDTYWIWDGIHPTPAGHYKMSELWIREVENHKVLNNL